MVLRASRRTERDANEEDLGFCVTDDNLQQGKIAWLYRFPVN